MFLINMLSYRQSNLPWCACMRHLRFWI